MAEKTESRSSVLKRIAAVGIGAIGSIVGGRLALGGQDVFTNVWEEEGTPND
jgi:ketopantoate reductase